MMIGTSTTGGMGSVGGLLGGVITGANAGAVMDRITRRVIADGDQPLPLAFRVG